MSISQDWGQDLECICNNHIRAITKFDTTLHVDSYWSSNDYRVYIEICLIIDIHNIADRIDMHYQPFGMDIPDIIAKISKHRIEQHIKAVHQYNYMLI